MEYVKVELPAAKETYEAGAAIAAVWNKVREQLSDGWKPGEDIPPILMTAFQEFLKAADGAGDIPAEFKEDPEAATNALYASLGPALFGTLKPS